MKTFDAYTHPPHGNLGIGKRPDELNWPDPEKFDVSTAEAKEILGISSSSVADLIRRDDLPGRRIGGKWFVRRGDVERRKAEQQCP